MTKEPKVSLFLDRDGVLNRRIPGEYVDHYDRFHWSPQCVRALQKFQEAFDYIFVVTNQQGIGKGLMTSAQLEAVHKEMLRELDAAGVHIHRVYHCPDLNSKPDNCRKPAPSMGYWAQKEFPEVNFDRSVMIGDSHSDLQFARGLGMISIWINGELERKQNVVDEDYDFAFSTLLDASKSIDEILYTMWFRSS